MGLIGTLHTWASGDRLFRTDLNGNFTAITSAYNATAVLTDVARTVAVGHTYTATQVFTPGSGFGVDVTTGGLRTQAGGVDVAGTSTYRGHVLFSADNTYDVGASLATRPRSLYVATSLVSPVLQGIAASSLDLKASTGKAIIVYPDASASGQWLFSGATPSHLLPSVTAVSNVGSSGNRIAGFYGGLLDLTGAITAASAALSGALTAGTGTITTLTVTDLTSTTLTLSSSFSAPTLTGTTAVVGAQFTTSGASPKLLVGSTALLVRNSGDTATILDIRPGSVTIAPTGDVILSKAGLGAGDTSGFARLGTVLSSAPTGAATPGAMVVDSGGLRAWWYISGAWRGIALNLTSP